jgi:hypothetical protein
MIHELRIEASMKQGPRNLQIGKAMKIRTVGVCQEVGRANIIETVELGS